MKLCECGCGQPAPIATYTSEKYGWVKGQPKRFIHNHHHRGKRNVNFNNGLCFDKSQKRWFVHARDRKYIAYARAVMESHLRRALLPGEVVHHINRDRTDDRLENLRLYSSNGAHMRAHRHSNEGLLQMLRDLATELGRAPKSSDLPRGNLPTRETYRTRFGGLRMALKKAGVTA